MFLSTFFLAMDIWGMISPFSWWLIGESWKSKDADGPSIFFVKTTRIVATLFIVVGAVGILDVSIIHCCK